MFAYLRLISSKLCSNIIRFPLQRTATWQDDDWNFHPPASKKGENFSLFSAPTKIPGRSTDKAAAQRSHHDRYDSCVKTESDSACNPKATTRTTDNNNVVVVHSCLVKSKRFVQSG